MTSPSPPHPRKQTSRKLDGRKARRENLARIASFGQAEPCETSRQARAANLTLPFTNGSGVGEPSFTPVDDYSLMLRSIYRAYLTGKSLERLCKVAKISDPNSRRSKMCTIKVCLRAA